MLTFVSHQEKKNTFLGVPLWLRSKGQHHDTTKDFNILQNKLLVMLLGLRNFAFSFLSSGDIKNNFFIKKPIKIIGYTKENTCYTQGCRLLLKQVNGKNFCDVFSGYLSLKKVTAS